VIKTDNFETNLSLVHKSYMKKIRLFVRENPFPTITEIYRFLGAQMNFYTIKWLVEFMVQNKTINSVHDWHRQVFFIRENIDYKLLVTSTFLSTKETVFGYLNQMDFDKKEIKKFISYYMIKDFTSIPKKRIRKSPLANEDGLRDGEDPIYQIVLKYLKILFFEFNIGILEAQIAKQENLDEFFSESKRRGREGQTFEILVELQGFLQRYGLEKQLRFEQHVFLKKALDLDYNYQIYRNCYFNFVRRGISSSVYTKKMTTFYMEENSEESPIKDKTIKRISKFVNSRGEPDIRALNETRRIENANDNLCSYDDIGELAHSWNYRKLTDLARLKDDKSLFEKAKSPFNGYYLDQLTANQN